MRERPGRRPPRREPQVPYPRGNKWLVSLQYYRAERTRSERSAHFPATRGGAGSKPGGGDPPPSPAMPHSAAAGAGPPVPPHASTRHDNRVLVAQPMMGDLCVLQWIRRVPTNPMKKGTGACTSGANVFFQTVKVNLLPVMFPHPNNLDPLALYGTNERAMIPAGIFSETRKEQLNEKNANKCHPTRGIEGGAGGWTEALRL